MEPDAVDAEPSQPSGHLIGVLVAGEVGRTGQVRGMQPDGPGVVDKPAAFGTDEAVFAGRRVEQMRHARRILRPVVRDQKREQGREVVSGLCW